VRTVEKPYLIRADGRAYLVAYLGADYVIPKDPVAALGLLAHLASKTWADREFLQEAVHVIAAANDWSIFR
jgi:hypothetical protein